MNVSQQWLNELVPFRMTPEQFVERLTMVGLEVEQVEDLSKTYDRFVVGEVLERQKHPNADRLSLCTVNIGTEVKNIVCGAPNVAAGQKVAVAFVGAVIPHDQHDPEGKSFVLERAKIRGVESDGMICSARELGLGEDANGILVLDAKAKPGTPLAKHLGKTDVIYGIGITPNRADCLSHIGVAREIGALVGKKAELPPIRCAESAVPASKHVSVKILDIHRCPRYCARILRNVKVGPSPRWMQDRLTAVGVRPINNVVDVTNFVLQETGHPLHAFDYDRLAGHAIIVRTAKEGERFVTLDGKERTLSAETLMICDAERPVAVAGVMGGANSEIGEGTTNILIESAFFDPRSIRRTSKELGLSTEASYRFERGADIEMAFTAVNRAAQLIQDLCGAEVLKGVIDAYPRKRKQAVVRTRISRINAVVGTTLKKNEVVALLRKIGIGSSSAGGDVIAVRVPSFRNDILEEIDVIEEVARVFGYNRIETKTRAAIDFTQNVRTDRLQDELRTALIGAGFHEILAISLQDEATANVAGESAVRVLNPVSVDMSTLRTSMVPGALRIVQYNRNHGSKDLRLFELGNVFFRVSDNPAVSLTGYREEERLLVLLSGQHAPVTPGVSPRGVDLLDLKGEVEALLGNFNLDKYRLIQYDTRSALTDPTVGVEINDTYAGFIGKVRKETAATFDVDSDVYVCELLVSAIQDGWTHQRKFKQLPKYPGVTRDLAFTVDHLVPQAEVERVIREAGGPLLTALTLFDVYVGQQAGQGKKSLAYALEFRSSDHTLTDTEAEAASGRIVDAVRRLCNGVLRG